MLRRIEAKKEKRKKMWIGVILTFLMIFGIMGIFIGSISGTDRIEYNGYRFTRNQNNVYVTEINDELFGFNYLPQSLLSIPRPANLNTKLHSPMVYVTFDPDSEVQDLLYIDSVRNYLQSTLSKDTIIINTITHKSDIYFLPVIGCENSTPFVPVIYFNVSNETSIVENNNCIVINAQQAEFLRTGDLLVYTYHGVI